MKENQDDTVMVDVELGKEKAEDCGDDDSGLDDEDDDDAGDKAKPVEVEVEETCDEQGNRKILIRVRKKSRNLSSFFS